MMEFSDDLFDFDPDDFDPTDGFFDYEPNYELWTTRAGVTIRISEMTDLHLENTIKMLSRGTYKYAKGYIRSMTEELNRRKRKMKIQNVKLKVVGVTFTNPDGIQRQSIISVTNEKTPIILMREPSNQYDKNAVAVYAKFGDSKQQVGYIGRDYAEIMATMMDRGTEFRACVADTGCLKGTNYLHITIDEV